MTNGVGSSAVGADNVSNGLDSNAFGHGNQALADSATLSAPGI